MRSGPDEAKFRRMFRSHFDAVNRYCLRRISVDEVNDIVGNVFVVAWRKIDRAPEPGQALPWLYSIARNEIRNRYRSLRRAEMLKSRLGNETDSYEAGPELLIVRNDELRQVMQALRRLPARDQEILLLRAHEDLDYGEIGVALGCSPEAARKRLSRALSRLRKAGGFTRPRESEPIRAMEGGDQ